jgi:bud emergence protein 1
VEGEAASLSAPTATALTSSKQVIRALYDYEAQRPQELSFSRGDFFHVIGRENDPDWYEACNPALPDARGLVPVSFFQSLGRTERDSGSQPDTSSAPRSVPSKGPGPDHDSGYGDAPTSGSVTASQRASKTGSRAGAMVYGVVMYDFQAERADELEAKAGEAIIVIAQSNPEWFVAKPIGRLGGPGLIPVTFVEIRDMASNTPVANPQDAVRRAGIPKVEEWKKMAADYKNSSITLGKFEVGGAPKQSLESDMERMSIQPGGVRPGAPNAAVQVSFNDSVEKFRRVYLTRLSSHKQCPSNSSPSNSRKHSNPDTPHSRIPYSKTLMPPNPLRSCSPPSTPGYPDTASLKTSTGL